MRKLLALGLGVTLAASLATSAFAGPSHAIVQELGTVVSAGEVNVDFSVVPLSLAGSLGAGNQVGIAGAAGAGTLGNATISSINAGLGNGFEVRAGVLPGLSSNLIAPAAAPLGVILGATTGLTVKYAGFVPGLSIYGGLGNTSNIALAPAAGGTAATTSATRFGAAYTTSLGGFIVNANVAFGSNTPAGAGATSTNVTDIGVAALYPLNANLLIGGEYLNTNAVNGANTVNASGLGLGARIIAGHFTVDALVYANVTETATGFNTNGNTSVVGYPVALNVNYAF